MGLFRQSVIGILSLGFALKKPPISFLLDAPPMNIIPRFLSRLALGVAAAGLLLAGCAKSDNTASAAPAAKTIRVGFAQTGAESQWRTANSKSLQDEAKARGITLNFVDCQSKPELQVKAVHDFITQKVDAIIIAPIKSTGWDEALKDAKDANIPVILEDRSVDADPSLYKCFIGSDFIKEGQMVANWLIQKTGGKGNIIEIYGEPGSAAAENRHKSFADAIAKTDLKIIDSQSGQFQRDKGKEVMEALLKAHPQGTFNIVFAHNDDMALGAIQAIQDAGLQPGKDIMVVSIDGEKEAVQAVADGKINCVVECNPMVGPLVFDAVQNVLAGKPVAPVTYNVDQLFDSTNAAAAAPTRPY
jgi:simple sugar transport system substrate-binding protein